jgi:hypothetical protein
MDGEINTYRDMRKECKILVGKIKRKRPLKNRSMPI